MTFYRTVRRQQYSVLTVLLLGQFWSKTKVIRKDIVRCCSDVVERTQEPLQLPANLRHSIRSDFFSQHIAAYSRSRRRAPIYWQLSIPSTQYSVWLYAHACTGETLYEVRNDFIALKLEHEE